MSGLPEFLNSFAGGWEVLMLFLIPIGGGIPAGVVLAHSRGMEWSAMMAIYFVSDLILAAVFEPLMMLVVSLGKRSAFTSRLIQAIRENTKRTTARFGTHLGPLTLIMISFGIDPMTGRAATAAAGHGFISGWLLTIAGDMLYFTVIMISTLWLNHILGDGTWTMIIILLFMLGFPQLVRWIREKRSAAISSKKL